MYPVRFTPLTVAAARTPGPARPAAGCAVAGCVAAADTECAAAPDARGRTAAVRPMARLLTGVMRTSWESFRMLPPRREFFGETALGCQSRLRDRPAGRVPRGAPAQRPSQARAAACAHEARCRGAGCLRPEGHNRSAAGMNPGRLADDVYRRCQRRLRLSVVGWDTRTRRPAGGRGRSPPARA